MHYFIFIFFLKNLIKKIDIDDCFSQSSVALFFVEFYCMFYSFFLLIMLNIVNDYYILISVTDYWIFPMLVDNNDVMKGCNMENVIKVLYSHPCYFAVKVKDAFKSTTELRAYLVNTVGLTSDVVDAILSSSISYVKVLYLTTQPKWKDPKNTRSPL